jgi:hypothetical protein
MARCFHPRQSLGAARAGDNPEKDLRLPELRALGGDDHVAQQGELAAAAQRVPRHRRHQRRRAARHARPEPPRRSGHHLLKAPFGHRLDIAAGGKDVVVAGDDDAAHGVVGVPGLDPPHEVLHQLRRQGVSALGAVQPRDADGLALLAEHRRLGHGAMAFTPVSARPMISFWIWEVPS